MNRLRSNLAYATLALLGCTRPLPSEEDQASLRRVLQAEHCQPGSIDGTVLRDRCGDTDFSIELANLWRELEGVRARADRDKKIEAFLVGLIRARGSAQLPHDRIFPMIKPRAEVEATLARLPPELRAAHGIAVYPFVGDLVLLCGEDLGNQIAAIDAQRLQVWKTTPAELSQLAMKNLSSLPIPPIESIGHGVVRVASTDGYAAVRILSKKVQDALAAQVGGSPVFAIPDREELLAARADDPSAVAALRKEAHDRFTQTPYALTEQLIGKDAQSRPILLPAP